MAPIQLKSNQKIKIKFRMLQVQPYFFRFLSAFLLIDSKVLKISILISSMRIHASTKKLPFRYTRLDKSDPDE